MNGGNISGRKFVNKAGVHLALGEAVKNGLLEEMHAIR
jgi:hypothetical protein